MNTPETSVEQSAEPTQTGPGEPQQSSVQSDQAGSEVEETCSADAFMDEEDSEAVAERLRQLGYI